MSQHIVEDGKKKFVFGWDQPLQSFYLQMHNVGAPDEELIEEWLTPPTTSMYEVEDLVQAARRLGLHIDSVMQTRLYAERDDGL